MTVSGRGGPRVISGVGFWAQQQYFGVFGPDGSKIFRPILRSLPEAWAYPPANAFQFWTYNLLTNTLAPLPTIFRGPLRSLPDQPPAPLLQQSPFPNLIILQVPGLPPGKNLTERPPLGGEYHVQLRIWTWSYNLNLIGQDQLPAGDQSYVLAPSQVSPEQVQLHSWNWSYNLNLIGRDRMLAGKQIWELPPVDYAYPRLEQTWAWSYNKNLIGQDHLPAGEQVYELAPPQKPYEQQQLHSWQWSYNLNLIGQDRLPTGEQVYERPTLPIPSALTWIEGPQYELIAKPFAQYDWPNPTPQYRIEQTSAASYNLNLIGQDHMATGQQITDLPPRDFDRAIQLRTWIQTVNLALTTAPPVLNITIGQREWPLPRGAEPDWRRSWEWSYNQNLIGQDQLPFRQQDWPLTPVQQVAQTWIQSVNLALTAAPTKPFKQTDWPLPIAPQQAALGWAWSYNLNLIGQDQLPNRQQDWPLTPAAIRAIDLATWINRVQFQLFNPFAQLDWPNPTAPARDPTLTTWLGRYNLNLIGQDQLPFRQQDWPNAILPDQFASLRAAFISALNLALNQMAPVLAPPLFMRNQDWPLPGAPIYANNLRTWPNEGTPETIIPGVPPPPVTGPAVYAKPMLAGPGYLNVIPGEKPS
jgi:hypothetical protein